jgi:Flp pilus assembly protein TadD/TolB-like protein
MISPWFRTGLLVICTGLFSFAGAPAARAGQTAAAPRATPAEARSQTLLVFPFENGSHIASLGWLGEGLSELTTERLQDRGAIVLSRRDRLAALEKIGLPDSARFSHATLVKIAGEADADAVIFGSVVSDGKTVTMKARILHISPPSLSPSFTETSTMQELLRAQARLTWQILCSMDQGTLASNASSEAGNTPSGCPAEGASRDETSFTDPPPSLQLESVENLIRGLNASDDEMRIRLLREASRLEPAWDHPPFELGLTYFDRHDCESALPWFSRVPPDRPNGAEASFDAGVCHLQRNDAARADAAFSSLIDRTQSADPKEKLPEFPDFHNNLGVARLLENNWADAGAEFERATALDPGEPDYLFNQAIAQLAAKLPAAAVAPLDSAVKLDPDDKGARALLIQVLNSLGRSSEAATLRTAPPDSAAHTPLPNLQNAAVLVRMARPSKIFDRALLRPAVDPPADPPAPGKTPAGNVNRGAPR